MNILLVNIISMILHQLPNNYTVTTKGRVPLRSQIATEKAVARREVFGRNLFAMLLLHS